MRQLLRRIKHRFTGHTETYLDRSRTYFVWNGNFITGSTEFKIPIHDQWHIRCTCGKCLRHKVEESTTVVQAESIPEVWSKVASTSTELMRAEGYPDVYPQTAQGIQQGFSVDLDNIEEFGIHLPEKLEN